MKRYRNIGIHSDLVDSLDPPEPVEEVVVEEGAEENEQEMAVVEAPDVEMSVSEEEVAMTEISDEEIVVEE